MKYTIMLNFIREWANELKQLDTLGSGLSSFAQKIK